MSEQKAKTIDGAPTPLSSLNVDSPNLAEESKVGPLVRLSRIYRRLNEVMAGMYTGVGCAGTPHEHHRYDESAKSKNPAD
ncbi:MAG: hypothetical protein COB20_14010 [SAR86 cluster bacterium]|uniref:Uncharacterized protein n=1 Tax=SAR86 cluster bacterium TaxID=2030880 RepID=A0A2A4WX85_9GAMM|nr:MAG: hypothetical protein COB20_14010 [SAR86 cluster bacterium]